ncbi:MAG: hypothetical protein KatS3mg102_0183 [Planctomycetota bacterium]|nr:MAG: hypothetical protein KatS3mg102_0183 [Planctomycetota bacterium]
MEAACERSASGTELLGGRRRHLAHRPGAARRRFGFALGLVLGTATLAAAPVGAAGAPGAPPPPGEEQIEPVGALEKVRFLADDARGGRAAGSEGNREAARYIIERLRALGITPAGDLAGAGAAGQGTPPGSAPSVESAYLQPFQAGTLQCHNIVALVRGREPASAEHVLLGAHYDHVGLGQAGGSLQLFKRREPAIHNGADDNASGSAALLEIAEALAALPTPPARHVVLVWFDAEERGLLGSQHYVRHPALPLKHCVLMLNLDMVGRSRGGRAVLLGATSGQGLLELMVPKAAELGLRLEVQPYMVPNSDHYPFYCEKVPVAFLTTGLHPDYHRPGDDADKIEADGLARVARLAYRTALLAADEPSRRFSWREVADAPLGLMALEALEALSGEQAFGELAHLAYGPVGGLVLTPRAEGLEVVYLEPDSPLAAAGLRAGDLLVRVRGGLLGPRARALGGPLARLWLQLAITGPPALVELRRGGERLELVHPVPFAR